MSGAGLTLSPQDFIRTRMPLVTVPGRDDIVVHRPQPQTGLNAWLAAQHREDTPPYWAYLWAGGLALAHFLKDHAEWVEERTVIDFGSGSGLLAIAAALAGANRIFAIEPDPLGRIAVELNAQANGVTVEISSGPVLPAADIILAGDVFYDAPTAAQTLPILSAAVAAGTKVLVGDPFRASLPLNALDLLSEYQVQDMGGGAPLRAGVFALHGRNIGNAGPALPGKPGSSI